MLPDRKISVVFASQRHRTKHIACASTSFIKSSAAICNLADLKDAPNDRLAGLSDRSSECVQPEILYEHRFRAQRVIEALEGDSLLPLVRRFYDEDRSRWLGVMSPDGRMGSEAGAYLSIRSWAQHPSLSQTLRHLVIIT